MQDAIRHAHLANGAIQGVDSPAQSLRSDALAPAVGMTGLMRTDRSALFPYARYAKETLRTEQLCKPGVGVLADELVSEAMDWCFRCTPCGLQDI